MSKAFGSKPVLLTAAVAHAMSGGEEGDLERQAWFKEPLDAPDAETQLRLVPRNARRLCERTGRLLEVVRVAGASDERAAALWQAIDAKRVARSRATAKRLATKAELRAGVRATTRTLWPLTLPKMYVLQVDDANSRPTDDAVGLLR